jgi:hypothetical protein
MSSKFMTQLFAPALTHPRRSTCLHLLAGNSPRLATGFSLRRQRKASKRKATLVPVRPERAAPAVLSLVGVSLNSLCSNIREPLSAQPCAPRHGHKRTQQPKGRVAACAPRALWGNAASRWPIVVTTESIANNAKQICRNRFFYCSISNDSTWELAA